MLLESMVPSLPTPAATSRLILVSCTWLDWTLTSKPQFPTHSPRRCPLLIVCAVKVTHRFLALISTNSSGWIGISQLPLPTVLLSLGSWSCRTFPSTTPLWSTTWALPPSKPPACRTNTSARLGPKFHRVAVQSPYAFYSHFAGDESEEYPTSGHEYFPCDDPNNCVTVGQWRLKTGEALLPLLKKYSVDIYNAGGWNHV